MEGIIPAIESAHALAVPRSVTSKGRCGGAHRFGPWRQGYEHLCQLLPFGRIKRDVSCLAIKLKARPFLADLYTPVSAYLRVRDSYPQSALMESSDYHGGENSRSFIGFNPLASISISHGKAISKMPDGSTIEKAISENYRVDLAIKRLSQFKSK